MLEVPSPVASVAMITYNHAPYIERAINSIMAQQVSFPIELVIGEDCSTDGTRELVEKCRRRFPGTIKVITSNANVGAHQNAVRTERACRGKYIGFCEGDDFWHDPLKLARQVHFFEQNAGYSLVHSHCDRLYVLPQKLHRNDLRVPEGLADGDAYEDLLTDRRYVLSVTVVTVRDHLFRVLDKCPECSDPYWPMGDTQRWLELSRLGKVGCIHESLATTCLLPESAGQSRDPDKRLRFFQRLRELKVHYLKKYPVNVQIELEVRRKMAYTVLLFASVAGNRLIAREMYQEYVHYNGRRNAAARVLLWGSSSKARARISAAFVKAQNKFASVLNRTLEKH